MTAFRCDLSRSVAIFLHRIELTRSDRYRTQIQMCERGRRLQYCVCRRPHFRRIGSCIRAWTIITETGVSEVTLNGPRSGMSLTSCFLGGQLLANWFAVPSCAATTAGNGSTSRWPGRPTDRRPPHCGSRPEQARTRSNCRARSSTGFAVAANGLSGRIVGLITLQ